MPGFFTLFLRRGWLRSSRVRAYKIGMAVVALRRSGEVSKRRQRFLLCPLDGKELRQAGDRKDLEDFRPQVAKLQLAAAGFHLLVEHDQLVECGGRQKIDSGKVEQDAFLLLLV